MCLGVLSEGEPLGPRGNTGRCPVSAFPQNPRCFFRSPHHPPEAATQRSVLVPGHLGYYC